MQKKLTITLDEQVYEGIYAVVGRGDISRFIEDLVRPHVISADVSESRPHSRTQADIDAMREDWGKWYAANPDKVLTPAEVEVGYRAQAEYEARMGDALYDSEDWEEWKEWYGTNDSISDNGSDDDRSEPIKLLERTSNNGLTDESR